MSTWADNWTGALGELEDALLDREALDAGITVEEFAIIETIRRDEAFGAASVREAVRRIKAGTAVIERQRGLL